MDGWQVEKLFIYQLNPKIYYDSESIWLLNPLMILFFGNFKGKISTKGFLIFSTEKLSRLKELSIGLCSIPLLMDEQWLELVVYLKVQRVF